MNVLAIEDQPVAGQLLLGVLKLLGHKAELVDNAETAWTRLVEGNYRVVVSDWRMPGQDGLDFCRRLRARPGDYVYFILISATRITKSTREAALAAGVDDFLAKPIDPDELGMRLHVAERILRYAVQVQQLESFLPMCSYCHRIRDDAQYWQQLETFFHQRQGPRFTHSVCPTCYQAKVVPQLRELGIETDPPSPA